jgi:AAA ATPase containing von Willebrand factor type A (vWA) domain
LFLSKSHSVTLSSTLIQSTLWGIKDTVSGSSRDLWLEEEEEDDDEDEDEYKEGKRGWKGGGEGGGEEEEEEEEEEQEEEEEEEEEQEEEEEEEGATIFRNVVKCIPVAPRSSDLAVYGTSK